MRTPTTHTLPRRGFLRAAGTLGVGALAGSLRARGRTTATPPSERIVMGHIGVGGQGGYHLRNLSQFPDVQIAAVCEVDAGRRQRAVDQVNAAYAEETASGIYRGCDGCDDFREVIARPDIDAVLIAAPDHWHAEMTVAAMEQGKDVYVEKPVSVSVAQGRAICAAARRYRRVVQVGSHERSRANARYAAELVRNGRLGKLHTITVNLPVDGLQTQVVPRTVMPVPDGLNWDLWLGPAPWAPYTERRCHFSFRYILDTAGGEMTDRGAHVIDLAQLALGTDDSGPVEIRANGWRNPDGLFDVFIKYDFEYRYASGVRLIGTDQGPRGIRYEGDEGWVFVHIHGGRLEASAPELLTQTFGLDEIHLGRSPGHHQDFLQAVRTRGVPMASAEAGHRTATLCHLTNIAMLTGEVIQWDPVAERCTNSAQVNRMLHRPPRGEWRV